MEVFSINWIYEIPFLSLFTKNTRKYERFESVSDCENYEAKSN